MSGPRFAPLERHASLSAWRLPLVALLIIGVATLVFVDRLLRREYVREATTQAVQTDALLESFLRQRVALLHSLRAVYIAGPPNRTDQRQLDRLVREIAADAPDLFAIYMLDSTGTVRSTHRQPPAQLAISGSNHFRIPERAEALESARGSRVAALTGTVALQNRESGMIAYLPIIRDAHVVGYIGGAFAYQALFDDALAEQLRGRFAYMIADGAGDVIAVSPDYPERVARTVEQEVALPGGRVWQLRVAIPPWQPVTARLVSWTAGLSLLALFALLVLREDARARRFAAQTYDLEQLSRDLLDANVRVEERAEQIGEANRAKSRFLANVSHELRTPLNAIVGYNSLALDGLYGSLPARLRDAHDRIGAAAEHLLGLVNDVLDLSKIEVGRMEVDVQETDLEATVDSVIKVVQPSADVKGLRLDVFIARDVPRLLTDPRHVRQILLNLAANAIKFTDRGSVTIVARRSLTMPEQFASIVVHDTGMGIAEHDLERIFEEFEQVRPSGRGDSMQRGAGLGLAISRKLARLLGGDIDVESRPGDGSRFTVELPLRAPAGLGDPATAELERPGSPTSESRGSLEGTDAADAWGGQGSRESRDGDNRSGTSGSARVGVGSRDIERYRVDDDATAG
ncbi:MAG TPA: ATP-binding protein [Gemmatimonadaceae bacterium]|nr:ATP-binding protein [Gemmatimonadaceae bacterium]